MKRKVILIILSVGLAVLSWYVTGLIQCADHALFAEEAESSQHKTLQDRLEMGRKLFVERCASCHNERGDKPLPGGPALSERKLTREVIVKNASGHLRKATEEQKTAVAEYVESFMKKK